MGMFDDIKCKYPLPVAGANDLAYQTKDTPEQWMDQYEIREDGTLWHEAYDTEDQSEHGKWKAGHPGEEPPKELTTTLASFCGCMAKINKRWEQIAFTGEIRFYTNLECKSPYRGWIEWSSYFLDGKLREINLINHVEIPK